MYLSYLRKLAIKTSIAPVKARVGTLQGRHPPLWGQTQLLWSASGRFRQFTPSNLSVIE